MCPNNEKKMKKNEVFNIVILGVGGQGIITLTKVIAQAALLENFDLKTSELHGLSQRGGSVQTSLRFGKKVYSPLVSQRGADLIISLELQEVFRAFPYVHKNTKFLVNDFLKPIPGYKPERQKILSEFKKLSKNIFLIPATDICKEKLQKGVVAGIFLISFATFKKLIPLSPLSIKRAIKKQIPGKYLELNLKAFELAKHFNSLTSEF